MAAKHSSPLEERVEAETAYQKPFVMECSQKFPFPEGISPYSDTGTWPIAVRVHAADVGILQGERDFLLSTDYRRIRNTSKKLLAKRKKVKFRFERGSAQFTFTKTEEGYAVSVKKGPRDTSGFDPAALPPVIVPGEVAAYQFAKILNEHYKDMAGYNETRLLATEKMQALELFSMPELRRQFEENRVPLYAFAGVPDQTIADKIGTAGDKTGRIVNYVRHRFNVRRLFRNSRIKKTLKTYNPMSDELAERLVKMYFAIPFLIGAAGGFCQGQEIPLSDNTTLAIMYMPSIVAGAGIALIGGGIMIMVDVGIKRQEYKDLEKNLDAEAARLGADKVKLQYPTTMEKMLDMSTDVVKWASIGIGAGILSTIGTVGLTRIGYKMGLGVGNIIKYTIGTLGG